MNYSSPVDRTPKKKRITPRSVSRPFTARTSSNAWKRFPSQRPKRERAYTRDIAGHPLRTKNFHSKKPDIISAPSGTRRSVSSQIKRDASRSTRFGGVRSQRTRNIYTQGGAYVNHVSVKPGKQGAQSNASIVKKLNRLQSQNDRRKPKKTKVVPRSASRPFMQRRSPNMWARFPRPKKKGERAVTTDLAGHPLEKKNYRTPRQEVIPNFKARKRIGDQPYQERGKRYSSATRQGKPWAGDVTGRRIRGRNYQSRIPSQGRGAGSVRPKIKAEGIGKFQGNIRRGKGFGAQGEEYTGNLKAKRAAKGGGSISGQWNNKGKAILGKQPGIGMWGLSKYRGFLRGKKGFSPQGEEYTGGIKARRPLKGGGSVSGKLWNNRQSAISGRTPGIGANGVDKYRGNVLGRKGFAPQGEEYTGNIRARKPLKGGGSVSGKLWNNRQSAISGRAPGIGARGVDKFSGNIRGRKGFAPQGEEYTGNIKARKPLKGGGSVSGKLWNNKQSAISGRAPGIGARGIDKYTGNIRGRKGFAPQGEEYTGNIKARKPLKGGGSVSGKLWNNKETPISGRAPGIGAKGIDGYVGTFKVHKRGPSENAKKAAGFPGKIKKFELSPGFSDQGEEYTGAIKAKKPLKGGGSISGKLWNNKETPIAGKTPKSDQGVESLGKKTFKRKYTQNPNASEASIRKLRPSESTYAVDGLQVRVRERAHGKRKNAPEGSIAGLTPSKETVKASQYSRVMKQRWDYVKNPNAADGALKTREPGKAFARASDYQGNIKMKKFDLFGKSRLHPDAQFMKTNKNNVAEEKDMLTNFKLWWARLFRKNETQPEHLKEKIRKPRYDKGEAGLWYD